MSVYIISLVLSINTSRTDTILNQHHQQVHQHSGTGVLINICFRLEFGPVDSLHPGQSSVVSSAHYPKFMTAKWGSVFKEWNGRRNRASIYLGNDEPIILYNYRPTYCIFLGLG